MVKREQVQELLEQYPELVRKISILRFELQRPPAISPEEIIDSMNFTHGRGEGHISGVVSNKTMYIALNYRENAERVNHELLDDIAIRLVPLERKLDRLEHYVSLLNPRMAQVIRLCYFEDLPWDAVAAKMEISIRSAQKLKNAAVDKLAQMYAFVDDPTMEDSPF